MAQRLNPIQKKVHEIGSDWIGEQIVRLGNTAGEVSTGIPGELWARQYNGREIRVINTLSVSPDFDARVIVRRSKFQPSIWRITEILEDYLEPVSAGRVAEHREQHEEGGFDRVALDRKQIKQLSVRAAGSFTVQVYGGAVQTPDGVRFVNNELLDLTSYAVTTGAKYITIESDDNGDLTVNEGTPFSTPSAGTYTDIPTPDPGKYPIAYILFFAGQTEIIDNQIRSILHFPGGGSSFDLAAEIHGADFETPALLDEIPGTDESAGFILKKFYLHAIYDLYVSEFGSDPNFEAAIDTYTYVKNPSATSVSDEIALFSGTTGKLLQSSGGITLSDVLSGWKKISQTWSYASADDPTYQIYVSGDVTANPDYKPGNKVKCTNNSTTFYGFIVKVGAYDSGNNRTPVDLYGGSDYDLANSAITAPYISKVKSPDGFPMNPDKWTVSLSNTSNTSIASPANGVWHNPGSLSISIPIGVWRVYYELTEELVHTAAAAISAGLRATLSTANNSESDSGFTCVSAVIFPVITSGTVRIPIHREKILNLTAKTSYYLNAFTALNSASSIGFRGDVMATTVKCVCAYL